MRLQKSDLLLYAITDRSRLKEHETLAMQVEQALKGGATMVQLREKDLPTEELAGEALELQALCRAYGVPFLINDHVALAKEIDADGVHVGQDDMPADAVRRLLGPDKIIGVTAKTPEQARLAEAQGADYLGSGAVFGSSTKTDARPMTMELLREITASVEIPVVAIGGITAANAAELQGSGVAGAAVVSGIFAAEDIKAAAAELHRILTETVVR